MALALEDLESVNETELLETVDDAVGNHADAFDIPDDSEIAGQTIVNVREMTDEEFERETFMPDNLREGNPVAIELSNGHIIFASADSEGNRAGKLFGQREDGTTFAF